MSIPSFLPHTAEKGPLPVLIGVGNWYRGDDAVGLAVVRCLRERLADAVRVFEVKDDASGLLDAWESAKRVILIDAVSSGAAPGTVHRFDARNQPLPAHWFGFSTHAFGVADAIELARVLDGLPDQLIVYGIEGFNFAPGEGLSPEVSEASIEVTNLIMSELAESGSG